MFILTAESKEGKIYYVNVIMFTAQKKYAQQYETRAEAEKDLEHFKNMFHYETISPEIEEI